MIQSSVREVLLDAVVRNAHGHLVTNLRVALRRKTPGDSEFERARMYAAPEKKREAIEELRAGMAEHSPALIFLKADPVLDRLRTARAFQDIERRIGLLP